MSIQTARDNDAIFCRISIDNGYTWVQGIITLLSTQNNSLQIYLSSKNFYKCANPKNKLIIKALDSTHENIYIGTISKSMPLDKSHIIKVNIESVLSFYNKRNYLRFPVNYSASIKTNDTTSFHVQLSDISFNGICFFSKHNLTQNSNISISITPKHMPTINLYGSIVNKIPYENEFRYSVSTTPQSIPDQEKLSHVMDYLLLKQNGIKSSYLSNAKLKIFLRILSVLLLCIGGIWMLFSYLK